MPPAVGNRFAPQHLSNPFANLNQHQLQQPHLAHPGPAHIQAQNFGGQAGFGGQSVFANPALHNANFGGAGAGLGSHAAQAGFHQAGIQQQQQQVYEASLSGSGMPKREKTRIREVWKHNLAQEMALLRKLVDKYPYISMVCAPAERSRIVTKILTMSVRIPNSQA